MHTDTERTFAWNSAAADWLCHGVDETLNNVFIGLETDSLTNYDLVQALE